MFIRRLTPLLIVALVALTGCSSGDGGNEKSASKKTSDSAAGRLFVASAADGRLEPQGKHEFTLVLAKANDAVGVFTDRPERKAGTESLSGFAAAWEKRGFAKTPPNAAVVWGKDSSSRTFELSDPAYDEASDTLSFTARDLGDEPSTALSSFKGTPDAELPVKLGEVSVFIDDASGDGSGGFFFFVGPAKGEATITLDDQSIYSTSFNVVKGRGGGRQTSPTQIDLNCLDQQCYIAASFTLSPGTWPVKGKLETSSGVTVGRSVPDGTTAKVPAGDFSYGEDGK